MAIFLVQAGMSIRFALLAIFLMGVEYVVSRAMKRQVYDLSETLASLAISWTHILIRTAEVGLVALPFLFVHHYRLFTIEMNAASWVFLFFLSELAYYWQHRAGHRIAFMWANHAVHHSATKLNLSAAVRLGWAANLSGSFLFLLPLVWIGFPPAAVLMMFGVGILYQFFIHADVPVRLGPLEWIFNTPMHHRIHHASNAACLDRNYGGVLIVFDRLFGTFAEAPAGETLVYGVCGARRSVNPVWIILREWVSLTRRILSAPDFIGAVRVLFGPPSLESRRSTPCPPLLCHCGEK